MSKKNRTDIKTPLQIYQHSGDSKPKKTQKTQENIDSGNPNDKKESSIHRSNQMSDFEIKKNQTSNIYKNIHVNFSQKQGSSMTSQSSGEISKLNSNTNRSSEKKPNKNQQKQNKISAKVSTLDNFQGPDWAELDYTINLNLANVERNLAGKEHLENISIFENEIILDEDADVRTSPVQMVEPEGKEIHDDKQKDKYFMDISNTSVEDKRTDTDNVQNTDYDGNRISRPVKKHPKGKKCRSSEVDGSSIEGVAQTTYSTNSKQYHTANENKIQNKNRHQKTHVERNKSVHNDDSSFYYDNRSSVDPDSSFNDNSNHERDYRCKPLSVENKKKSCLQEKWKSSDNERQYNQKITASRYPERRTQYTADSEYDASFNSKPHSDKKQNGKPSYKHRYNISHDKRISRSDIRMENSTIDFIQNTKVKETDLIKDIQSQKYKSINRFNESDSGQEISNDFQDDSWNSDHDIDKNNQKDLRHFLNAKIRSDFGNKKEHDGRYKNGHSPRRKSDNNYKNSETTVKKQNQECEVISNTDGDPEHIVSSFACSKSTDKKQNQKLHKRRQNLNSSNVRKSDSFIKGQSFHNEYGDCQDPEHIGSSEERISTHIINSYGSSNLEKTLDHDDSGYKDLEGSPLVSTENISGNKTNKQRFRKSYHRSIPNKNGQQFKESTSEYRNNGYKSGQDQSEVKNNSTQTISSACESVSELKINSSATTSQGQMYNKNKSVTDNTYHESENWDLNANIGSKICSRKSDSFISKKKEKRFSRRSEGFLRNDRERFPISVLPYDFEEPEFQQFLKEMQESSIEISDQYKEIEKDLFLMPEHFSLAHCVAEDMRMGSGIAVSFRQIFKNLGFLMSQKQKPGGLAVLENKKSMEKRYIYYLVTKQISANKPSYQNFWMSLKKLRDHIRNFNVRHLAIPKIGCGLDRLDWSLVRQMINFLFREYDIEIVVCSLHQTEETCPQKNNSCKVVQNDGHISEIDEGTIILYFSTEKGELDTDVDELRRKFRFEEQFAKIPKRLGDVIKYKHKDKFYILYGCIVRKSKKDSFDFESFEKCLLTIKEHNKQDQYQYIAFQTITDHEDGLINEKILTLMRNTLQHVEIYVCQPSELEQ